MKKNKALIAGALGVVGRAAAAYISELNDWEVIGVSRREPDFQLNVRFLQLDLTDSNACRAILGRLNDVTHIFYCAYSPQPTFSDEADVNLVMLKNLVSELNTASSQLKHVQLVHGSKWYGCHVGPYKTPAKEDDPRTLIPCFYFRVGNMHLVLSRDLLLR